MHLTCGAEPIHQQGGPPYKSNIEILPNKLFLSSFLLLKQVNLSYQGDIKSSGASPAH